MDFFSTQFRKGTEFAVLHVVDAYTKEILGLTAHEGRGGLTTNWVARRIIKIFRVGKRWPKKLVHDRDPLFRGQVMRLCAIEEIEDLKTPPRYPNMNAYAERTILSVKNELINHIRTEISEDLQRLLDYYRAWFNEP